MNHEEVIEKSYFDLLEDAGELEFLARDLLGKLNLFQKQLNKQNRHLGGKTALHCQKRTDTLIKEMGLIIDEIDNLKSSIRDHKEIQSLIDSKSEIFDLLRIQTSEVAGVITATNWQAPSFDFSGKSQAGIWTGQITGMINDYSRDQSIPGQEYEKKFSHEFVGRWRGLPVPVFLTNSGMGALTTIISFLLREKKLNTPVLMGQNSYFQNKELILKLLTLPVMEFDEEKQGDFENKYNELKPSVIFVDSLSNTANQTRPDLKKMIRFLAKTARTETYLVIDNTCACLNFEPLKALFPRRGKLKLLVWESLNKYYQFGMDRTLGGFVWGLLSDSGAINYARRHTGSIMSDVAQAMLPTPNRLRLRMRLERIMRNARYTAESLGDKCIYRGMGGSLVLKINQGGMNRILRKAKKQRIPLIAGTSFGFNVTRIYLTASRTTWGEPFVRLSLGTETMIELERVIKLLVW